MICSIYTEGFNFDFLKIVSLDWGFFPFRSGYKWFNYCSLILFIPDF